MASTTRTPIRPVSTPAEPAADKTADEKTVNGGPGFSTLSVHAGEARQKPGDSITDPIFCASTYTFPDTQAVIDFIEQKQPREEYGRYGNPGERVVERKLAALEGGEAARALFQRHGGDRRPADGQAQRRRRSGLLRRVLPPQPRVLHQAPVAVRRDDAAGDGLRLRRDGSRHHAAARGCWSANRPPTRT